MTTKVSTVTGAVTPPAKKAIRLNIARQTEAIAFWKSGTMTLEELSKKFKVDTRTLSRLFEKMNAKKGETAEATKKIAAEAVESSITSDAIIYAQRVKDTKEEHYKMANTLAKLIYSKIVQAEKQGLPTSGTAGDMKALNIALASLKIAREERYATLGIRADDVAEDKPLPDLIVQELTVEDIREMSKGNMVNDDDIDFDTSMGDEDFIEKEEHDDKVITE